MRGERVHRRLGGRSHAARALLVTSLLLSLSGVCFAESAYRKNKAGNDLYEEQKYDEAFKKYAEAQAERPDLLELKYNEANALYRMGKQQDASKLFKEAFAFKDRQKKHWSSYNLGNAYMRAGELDNAIESYVRALHLDPTDQQAKTNLELALKRKDEEQKKQQEDQKQPPPPKQQDQKEPPPPEQDVNQKQMNSMLDYLREKEREDMKKQNAKKKTIPVGGKDW